MPIKTYKYHLSRGESVFSAYNFFDQVCEIDPLLKDKIIYKVIDKIICVTDMPLDSQEYINDQSLVTRTIFFEKGS